MSSDSRNIKDGMYENTIGQVGLLVFMHEENADALITVSEAAKKLRLSERRVQGLIDEGKLIGIKVMRDLFVFKNSVRNFGKTLDELPF